MDSDLFQLTDHARLRMRQRGVEVEWIERALENPDRMERDPNDDQLRRVYKRIHDAGDAVMRVVYNPSRSPVRIVTVLWEARRKSVK